ncbi:MAG TPA: hypothetical protein VMH22_12955 [bacterium]|nr:hypothetical protein [bacterium]
MRLTALLVLLATAAVAGPVGRYLGFAVHRQAEAIDAARDSFHILIPSPFDSIVTSNSADTATVVAETVRLGDSAWVISQVAHPTPDTVTTDTCYESGDTLLCARQLLGDSVRWVNAYRVPFNIGDTWRFGLAGTYIGEFTGDTIVDTLKVWADTCTVLDTEDVVVPYGAVPHCFKIQRTMYQRIATVVSSVPAIESSYVRTYEWYKDSLWSIKESTQASGPLYAHVGHWMHAGDFVSTEVVQLTGLGYLDVAERPSTAHRTPFTVSPNPFSSSTVLHLTTGPLTSTLRIFNSAGRLVRALIPPQSLIPSPYSLSWDGRDDNGRSLPGGAYFIRAGNEVCPVTKVR